MSPGDICQNFVTLFIPLYGLTNSIDRQHLVTLNIPHGDATSPFIWLSSRANLLIIKETMLPPIS
jgi:hypothetical protein